MLIIAQLSSRQSVATNAAGIDNAGSKWSREAQTKFVPRGLRQDSIINGYLFHNYRKYFDDPLLFATEPGMVLHRRFNRKHSGTGPPNKVNLQQPPLDS